MIYVNEKLKYMFEHAPANYYDDEDTKKSYRGDMMVYCVFKEDEIKGIPEGGWSVLHKDGDMFNDALDNLELIIFKDDKFFKDNKDLENRMLSAKRNAEEKEALAKKVLSERTVDKLKIDSLTKQVAYEQSRIKELNKELNKKEKEIRRLMDIIEAKNKYT